MTEQILKKLESAEGHSGDIIQENIAQLKQLFPEAFTETGLDFTVLRQLLGDAKVLSEEEEKFGLNWKGKKKARQISLLPSHGTLLPCPQESVDWDKTQNLFIEGDNLEVLKLLRRSYANKVKMIYIDPPYNTGKEFIYPDDFKEGLEFYLDYTGQKAEDGWNISKEEREKTGRKHSNWLSMMLPRLRLARDLLREDGVIFISIDDNEQAHLKDVCDYIFGEENFVGDLVRKTKSQTNDAKNGLNYQHEFVLVYAKNQAEVSLIGNKKDISNYKNPDGDAAGAWVIADPSARSGSENARFPIKNPYTGTVDIPPKGRYWAFAKETFEKWVKSGKVKFRSEVRDNERGFIVKKYLSELKSDYRLADSLFAVDNAYMNQVATKELNELFGEASFIYPKPANFIKEMIKYVNAVSTKPAIILDFFAGSCTTADAVMQLNSQDGGKRRYIMVQLPEKIADEKSDAYRAGYRNIAEIGKERIRRAAAKIQKENPDYQGDCGFKVFKLASSNIKLWNPDQDIEQSILDYQDNLVPGRSEQDVLYELLLKRGVDLTVPIAARQIAGKNVYNIGYGKIFACLDDSLTQDCIEKLADGIAAWREEALKAAGAEKNLETQIVFKDAAFGGDDVAKSNMVAFLTQSGIKEQHIRSL